MHTHPPSRRGTSRDVTESLIPRSLRTRFEPLGILGRGGMGVVFKAYDRVLTRRVALKLLHSSAPLELAGKRLEREAAALGRIHHPGVVRLLDACGDAGSPFIVMELLTGQTLAQRLESAPLDRAEFDAVIGGVLAALGAVHAEGHLHRDIKPSNVFLDRDRGPVLIDFGIVRRMGVSKDLTVTGTIVGTPRYMAPEIVEGSDPSVRSDLFSLGLVAYESLVGTNIHHPVPSSPGPELLHTISRLASGVYFDIASKVLRDHGARGRVVLAALAPAPSARPASAQEMRDALLAAVRTR